jgi:hypothetical protein
MEMDMQLVLSKRDAIKLLAILEKSLITDDALTETQRLQLMDIQFDMIDRLADFLGVNLEEGIIDPDTFEYVKFKY